MDNPSMIINFVLDGSQSMDPRRKQTISAVNEYIGGMRVDAKEKDETVLFSLTVFNTSIKVVHAAVNIQEVPDITEKTYVPKDMTALLDAIGITVETVTSIVDENKWRPAILCVIMTDGQENCSSKFCNEDIQKLIAEKEGEGNWTFVYLGAEKDAWNTGAKYGFSKEHSVGYDTKNMIGTMSALRCSTQNYMHAVTDMDADGSEVLNCENFFEGANADLFRGIDLGDNESDKDDN